MNALEQVLQAQEPWCLAMPKQSEKLPMQIATAAGSSRHAGIRMLAFAGLVNWARRRPLATLNAFLKLVENLPQNADCRVAMEAYRTVMLGDVNESILRRIQAQVTNLLNEGHFGSAIEEVLY